MQRIARFVAYVFSAWLPAQGFSSAKAITDSTQAEAKSFLDRWDAEGRFQQTRVEIASICDGSTPSAGRV